MPPTKTKTTDRRAYMRAYFLAHKDRINENRRLRSKTKRGKKLQAKYRRTYYLKHREQEIAKVKLYQERKKQLRNANDRNSKDQD